jgi:hypothetical protein
MLSDNILVGKLADGCTCALVDARDLDALEARLTATAGRELYPGELYGAAAQELGVRRIYGVRCPAGQRLDALLCWTGPGQVDSLGELPTETEEDLQIAGL